MKQHIHYDENGEVIENDILKTPRGTQPIHKIGSMKDETHMDWSECLFKCPDIRVKYYWHSWNECSCGRGSIGTAGSCGRGRSKCREYA